MNLGEIVARVQRQFGDESEVQIYKTDIVRWVNDGQVDIARKTECLQQHAETMSVAADGSYHLPENFISLKRVTYNNALLKPTTLGEVDKAYPLRDDGTITGTPAMYFAWGTTLYIYPPPDTGGTGNLDIWYVKSPDALVNNEDIPEIPIYMHEDIVRYCLARAKELDQEDSKAQALQQEYENRLAVSRHDAQTQHSDSYPAIRLLEGDDG